MPVLQMRLCAVSRWSQAIAGDDFLGRCSERSRCSEGPEGVCRTESAEGSDALRVFENSPWGAIPESAERFHAVCGTEMWPRTANGVASVERNDKRR